MDADLDRLAQGKSCTDAAADHMDGARTRLRSVEVSAGMFGQTGTAADAEAVVSRVHAGHVRALGDHHKSLTWIGEQTKNVTIGLGGADRAGGAAVRGVNAVDPRG
jgi:hypothetical protein